MDFKTLMEMKIYGKQYWQIDDNLYRKCYHRFGYLLK